MNGRTAEAAIGDLVVMQMASDAPIRSTRAVAADEHAVVLRRTPGDGNSGRFVWLEIIAPDGAKLRLLGEVTDRDTDTTSVKVKHLWPRDRARYMELVASAFGPTTRC